MPVPRSCAAIISASTAFVVATGTRSSSGRNGPVTLGCSACSWCLTRGGGGSVTRAAPQSTHTAIPSRYSLRHSGHHTVDMPQCYVDTGVGVGQEHGGGAG